LKSTDGKSFDAILYIIKEKPNIMKNSIKIIAMLLVIAVGLIQCEKDKTTPYTTGNYWIEGTWKATYFNLNGVQHTDFYEPYVFEFKESRTVSAIGQGKRVSGKWSINNDKLSLDFGTVDPFSLLNSDGWNIVNKTTTTLKLQGGMGSDDFEELTLEKIR
jgi:hypothetical protein